MTYEFINKALFFPEKGILVVGDLHIGYDYMLRQSGILIPERQVKEIISDLKEIIKEIREKRKQEISKIIFLGDIKHAFTYEFQERDEFLEIMDFLKTHVLEENIILVKGNHDTMDYTTEKTMKPYHIEENVAFLHGHTHYPEIYDKRINLIISGHLHPAIALAEDPGVKKEIFKCFLVGKSKGKDFVVIPSFVEFYEGTPVNDYKEEYIESFSIIPEKDILNADVHVIGGNKIYHFGKIKDL